MEPLLEPVPDRLVTPRLIIRGVRADDSAQMLDAIAESIDALRPYVPWAANGVPSPTQCEANCRRFQARFLLREDLTMAVFERDANGAEGAYIGGTGLHRIDWAVRRFEIGYWCRSSRVGKGLIGEAVAALTRCAFEQLKALRVELRVDEVNARSWRVAERAGYVLEGVLRSESLASNGEPRDMRVYASTRSSYATRDSARTA